MPSFRAKRTGSSRVQLAVRIPASPDGTVGRKCPACRRYFKVEGSRLMDAQALWCVYCGATGGRDEFLTLDQRRRLRSAAARWAMGEIHRHLSNAFANARRHSSGAGITMSFEVGRVELPPLLTYVERETGRELRCRHCGGLAASYGIAIFCPFCGTRDSREPLAQSIEAARTVVHALGSLPAAERGVVQAAGGEDRALEHVLGDTVTAFETYCRTLYSEREGEAALAALQRERGRNVFQRLDDAVAILSVSLDTDLTAQLTATEWSELRLAFAQRHVLTHNFGVVDNQFVTTTGTGTVGQRIQVSRSVAERALVLLEKLTAAMV